MVTIEATFELKWLANQCCHFALPYGRTKNQFEMDWPNKPHTYTEALEHANRGGNVGILTGKHSDNIVAVDRDVDFESTVAMLGELGKTAKIIRDNAPGRGKFLYRINGIVPPTISWKPVGEKRPHAEFLGDNGQRHALCPPSKIDDGCYRLIDTDYGIQEITPIELDYIWRLITGGSIYKDVRNQEEAEAEKQARDEYVRQTKDAWTVQSVFEHFDKAKNGTEKDRGETRILGNGGLLISAEGTQWYIYADSIGGDKLDAWAWCKWKKRVDRQNPKMFWDVLGDMAAASGIVKPTTHTNGNKPASTLFTREATEPDTDQFFLAQSADDEGNAQCVNQVHGAYFRYCDAYGWMQNTGLHWIYGGLAEKEINLSITSTLIDRRIAAVKTENERIIKATKPSSANKINVKNQFKDIVWCDVGIFDQEKHLLNCKNGIVDLRTGQLLTSESSAYFTYCVNAEYHPGLDMQEWTTWLSVTIGDYENISDWLQMACGYSITGYTNEEIMFYNFGPTRSGKGTFVNTYLHMLEKPLARGVSFSMFTARREGDSQNFDLAPLKPCRFIAASESGKYQALNEAVVKQVTGNDPISASFKGKDGFAYFPQFKIWLSSNHPIKGDVDDDAFWGRVKVIEFPNSHLDEEDKSLKTHMQTPEYCSMVLTYSVLGAQRWHTAPKGMITPSSVKRSVAEQRSQLDSIQRWLDECTKRMNNVSTPNDALRTSYEFWCKQNGEAPKLAVQFGKTLVAKGYEATNVKDHGMSKRGYKNIALLAPEAVDSKNNQDRDLHW